MTSLNSGTTSPDVQHLAELARDIRIAMLTTMDADGNHLSRPMAQQEIEFDGDLWFFAERSSRKVANIELNPAVGVTLSSSTTWISLHGSASIVDDLAKKKDLWNTWVESWFTDGPEDPNVVLIKVDPVGAEYWDTPGGRIASVINLVKSKLTGKQYEGDNERVDL